MKFDQPPKAQSKIGKHEDAVAELSRPEKEARLQTLRREIDSWGDGLGYRMDERIKDAVAIFNVMGLTTSASCEGHYDEEGFPAPWIDVQALDEPKWRFEHEEEIYEKVARKYKIPVEDVLRMRNKKAWKLAVRLSDREEETAEFKKWHEENEKLFMKMESLLQEFYIARNILDEVRIVADKYDAIFRVHNGGKFFIFSADEERLKEELTEEDRKRIPEVLRTCQAEMNLFVEFLKTKYFSTI